MHTVIIKKMVASATVAVAACPEVEIWNPNRETPKTIKKAKTR